jgi:catechol 2,3-dioxygenase-like lactoylglutathione lyase family enzyme
VKVRFLKLSALLLAAVTLAPKLYAQDQPRIIGMAHMAYYVSDLKQARDYYEGFLGFEEAFTLKNQDGTDHVVFIKINDHQFIELYAEPVKNYGFVHDAGFETNDANGMRDHLASIGVTVPARVTKNEEGDLSFDFLDPAGFTIQIVQYMPGSKVTASNGKFMPAGRISDHIDHIGLLIKDRDVTWKFYSDAFGFTKEGDGSKMAIPGSADRFEVGWERKKPEEARFHIKDHICLSNSNIPKMTSQVAAKPQMKEFPDAIADVHQLGNGKNVVELYDLNKNRVEVMEPPKVGDAASAAAASSGAMSSIAADAAPQSTATDTSVEKKGESNGSNGYKGSKGSKGGNKGAPRKVELPHPFYWAATDSLRGDWQGEGGLVAQVVPIMDKIYSKEDLIPQQEDNAKYEVHLFKQFDQPHDIPVAVLNGTLANGTLPLEGDGWTGTIEAGHFKAKSGDQSIDMQHVARSSSTLGMKPPNGATVLFDGKNLDSWSKMVEKEWLKEDGPCMWHLVAGGAVESVPRSGNCISKKTFGDAKIHVEFRNIGGPTNSGVYIQDRYEVNINETYGSLSSNPNGQFDNSIATKPGIRASRPVLEWQTLDINFKAPRFDASGQKTGDAVVTLMLNGEFLYKDHALGPVILNAAKLGEAPTGPIQLQEHGMPVQFRNIWVLDEPK